MGPLSRAARLLAGLYLFLAALWCGVLLSFAGGAGIVLRSAPSRAAGGAVNRALLDAADEASYAAAFALLVLFFVVERARPFTKLARGLTLRLLIVAAAATIVSHLLITPEMVSLRERAGAALDLMPKSDPLRRDWGQLHGLSVLALLLRIGCAAGVFALGFSPAASQPPRFGSQS